MQNDVTASSVVHDNDMLPLVRVGGEPIQRSDGGVTSSVNKIMNDIDFVDQKSIKYAFLRKILRKNIPQILYTCLKISNMSSNVSKDNRYSKRKFFCTYQKKFQE